jgi:phosphatidylglycerophosphate synthase
MIDNAFRAMMPRLSRPMIALYGRLGWTPNHVTVLGCSIAILASTAVALHFWWLAFALWWLSRLADGTDGVYARETGQESDFGAYFDIVLDMAAYGAMVLGFAIAVPELQMRWLAMLFLYVLCISTALALGMQEAKRAVPPRDNRGLRLGAGLAEGGETGIAYSVFLLLPNHLDLATAVWIGILLFTVIARSFLAYQTLGAARHDAPEIASSPVASGTTQGPESPEV